MLESNLHRPHAEIVFLSITSLENQGIKIADLIQAIAPDIHTKTYSRRHFDGQSPIDFGKYPVQSGQCPTLRQRVILEETRIAANRSVVGERRYSTDHRIAVSATI